MSTPQAPSRGAANGGRQIPQPIKRHLPFSSMKPPFIVEDYHRFSTPAGAAPADVVRIQEAEAIVVKSPVSFCSSESISWDLIV